jgi:hypothetical protein
MFAKLNALNHLPPPSVFSRLLHRVAAQAVKAYVDLLSNVTHIRRFDNGTVGLLCWWDLAGLKPKESEGADGGGRGKIVH